MITPATLLRDTALGGLVLAVGAVGAGSGAACGVAVGALVSIGSVAALSWACQAVGTPAFGARLLLQKTMITALVLLVVGSVPAVPFVVGFLAFFPSMVLRAAAGAVDALRGRGALAFSLTEPG
jgi:hypothetical protein